MHDPEPSPPPGAPWWKFPLVWMIIAGPAAVVVAGFVTLWLAVSMPDPVVAQDGRPIGRTQADKTLLPALAGRNHVVTPGTDVPAPGR